MSCGRSLVDEGADSSSWPSPAQSHSQELGVASDLGREKGGKERNGEKRSGESEWGIRRGGGERGREWGMGREWREGEDCKYKNLRSY